MSLEVLSHFPRRPMRRGTTTCSMSCWQVWTTGTNRSSTCKEPRPITTWTKYITHQWTQTTLISVFFFFFVWFFYNISSPFCICYTCRTFSFFSLGWSLWTEGQARQARLPAFGSVLWDHRPACWSDLHRLGHPLLYPAARQHVLQLIWGACA